MRTEKKYLVKEVGDYLERSDYIFLADYKGVSVAEAMDLRGRLSQHGAEFHVVKNRLLNIATRDRDYPSLDEWLKGPTALISGGEDTSGVAKTLKTFHEESKKVVCKVGVLDQSILSPEDIETLASLPSLDVLRSQLLSLLSTPAQQLAQICQAAPRNLLNVLNAKAKQD